MKVPPDTLAAYLESLRSRAKLSVRQLAAEAGYAGGSSVQKFLEDPSYDQLQLKIAQKFAKALYGKGNPAITLSDLAPLIGTSLDGPNAITPAALANLLQLPAPVVPVSSAEVEEASAGRLPVVGSAYASFWMPSAPSLDEVEEWLTIPFSSSKPLPGQYVLRIIGPSINRTAPEGSYAICQQYGNGVHALEDGKFVHAERERESDGEVEWTLKKLKRDGSEVLLCPHSDHKDHQKPLPMGGDGYHVTIKGIVIGWYRPA